MGKEQGDAAGGGRPCGVARVLVWLLPGCSAIPQRERRAGARGPVQDGRMQSRGPCPGGARGGARKERECAAEVCRPQDLGGGAGPGELGVQAPPRISTPGDQTGLAPGPGVQGRNGITSQVTWQAGVDGALS